MLALAGAAAGVALAAAIAWAATIVRTELARIRAEATRNRTLTLLTAFAPAIGAAQSDPRAILAWQPAARAARALFPEEFAAIDRAVGAPFPLSPEHLQAAHAHWTADWLAWERTHDATYKRLAAEAEQHVAADPSPAARARLDAIEREKLDLYQRRYEEYIRVARALQSVQN
jgi:hypothetical protein